MHPLQTAGCGKPVPRLTRAHQLTALRQNVCPVVEHAPLTEASAVDSGISQVCAIAAYASCKVPRIAASLSHPAVVMQTCAVVTQAHLAASPFALDLHWFRSDCKHTFTERFTSHAACTSDAAADNKTKTGNIVQKKKIRKNARKQET